MSSRTKLQGKGSGYPSPLCLIIFLVSFLSCSLVQSKSHSYCAENSDTASHPPRSPCQDLAPSKNSSQPPKTFKMVREFSWSNQDFSIKEDGGNITLKVATKYAGKALGLFQTKILGPAVNQSMVVNINTRTIFCGISQTYKTSTGFQFKIKPHGFLTDDWIIKKSGNLTSSYVWDRSSTSLSGPIKEKGTGRTIEFQANMSGSINSKAKVYGSKSLGFLRGTIPRWSEYAIYTNNEIPIVRTKDTAIIHFLRTENDPWKNNSLKQ
ncbi:hypothetical protein O181_022212 [Austropuccinia psidii MF-1]|uniref:Uncharacterized protein n=1 Tax=Austropuccinia psidii MF-1 TaxID=1389203 RepID=A0A9Q3CF20_9BASI|nr:hypothetical protein [Austropuccinia psidii MF-1]